MAPHADAYATDESTRVARLDMAFDRRALDADPMLLLPQPEDRAAVIPPLA